MGKIMLKLRLFIGNYIKQCLEDVSTAEIERELKNIIRKELRYLDVEGEYKTLNYTTAIKPCETIRRR